MSTLRDIKRRISSVKNTEQITKAMKMVAASRLRRAQDAILASRPYAHKMLEVLSSLALRTNPQAHPLLQVREPKKVDLVVVTSDRGLCGAFNANIIREAERRSYTRLSLETGSMEAFAPARALYTRFGFAFCDPFASYAPDPNSVFMTRALSAA